MIQFHSCLFNAKKNTAKKIAREKKYQEIVDLLSKKEKELKES